MRGRLFEAVAEYESILDVIAFYERGERPDIAQAVAQRFKPILDVVQEFTTRYAQAKAMTQGVVPRDG